MAQSATASRQFSQTVKNKTHQQYQSTCFVCDDDSPHSATVAHVVAAKAGEYESLQHRGLTSLPKVNAYENALPLCANCHLNFDKDTNPGFVIYPLDLDWFISREESDFQDRCNRFKQSGGHIPRIVPTAAEYKSHCEAKYQLNAGAVGGLYQVCLLRLDSIHKGSRDRYTLGIELFPPKSWHGDPLSLLHRTFRTLTIGDPIPQDDYNRLTKLQHMYGSNTRRANEIGITTNQSPPPSAPGAISTSQQSYAAAYANSCNLGTSAAHANMMSCDGACDGYDDYPRPTVVKEAKSEPDSIHQAWMSRNEKSVRRMKPIMSDWLWGPRCTTDDIVRKCDEDGIVVDGNLGVDEVQDTSIDSKSSA